MAVCDPVEALQLLDHDLRPSLVVTDFMMPKLTGLDVIAEIRTHQAIERVPVVLLSAMRVAENGDPFTIILRKPFEPEAFVDLVEELLEVSQAA
jgi:CheY-like chemotaxis protein